MPIKAILFDKDGTLIDFNATFGPATALVIRDLAEDDADTEAALAKAIQFNMETFAIAETSVLIAGSLENIVVEWMKHLPGSTLEEMMQRVDDAYEIHSLKTLAPFEFLKPTLDKLKDMGMPLGIATNDSATTATAHMNALGLTDRFTQIIGFDSGYGEKPGPGMVMAFVEHMGLAARNVMMVGDSTHDLKAARAAGVIPVAVTSGMADDDALAPFAEHVLPDISHLPALVEKLNEQVSA